MRKILLVVSLSLIAALARADGINNPASGGSSGQVGFVEGINNLGVGGSVSPVGCNGTIDFSTGCVAPMVGGL